MKVVLIISVFILFTACVSSNNTSTLQETMTEESIVSLAPNNQLTELAVPTSTSLPTETSTPTPETVKLGIEALSPEELERYHNLTEEFENVLGNPEAKIDLSIQNKFNMYINTKFIGEGEDLVLTDEQLKASKVFEEIMYFVCEYGLMPNVANLELKNSFSFFSGVDSRLPQSVSQCIFTPEILRRITESGWKIQINYFLNDVDMSLQASKGFNLDSERVAILENDRRLPFISRDENEIITQYNTNSFLFGFGPDIESILDFAKNVETFTIDNTVIYSNVLVLKNNLLPFEGIMGDNIFYISFLPPDVDPKTHGGVFSTTTYPQSHFYYNAALFTTEEIVEGWTGK